MPGGCSARPSPCRRRSPPPRWRSPASSSSPPSAAWWRRRRTSSARRSPPSSSPPPSSSTSWPTGRTCRRTRSSCAPRPSAAAASCAPWARTAATTRWCASPPSPAWSRRRPRRTPSRGIRIITRVEGAPSRRAAEAQPELARRPEIIQGLRNLIQNAVDFAASTVWIDLDWTDAELRVAIGDDGPGYPPDLIGRIGDPFLGRRAAVQPDRQAERPGYEGMGLGLFIAKTLLERTGARLRFGNGGRRRRRRRRPIRPTSAGAGGHRRRGARARAARRQRAASQG